MLASQDAADDRLAQLLRAWRRDIRSVPVPPLVDTDLAVEVIRIAKQAARVRASPDERTHPAAG